MTSLCIALMAAMLSCASVPDISDSGLLWLVCRDSPLASDFEPQHLIEYQGVKLRSDAHKAFLEMLSAMDADGISGLRLQSAYRPHSYQSAIFDQRVKELMQKGMAKEAAVYQASQSIQYPGASEHQTGLALDVSVSGTLTQSFAETNAGQWLDENSHNFGFIIRYPESKTDVTRIIYEPWHLRYVGNPHASMMKKMDLTLEEYWSHMPELKTYMVWEDDNDYYLVIYTDTLPDKMPSEAIDISSIGRIENAQYIMTMKKTYPIIEIK